MSTKVQARARKVRLSKMNRTSDGYSASIPSMNANAFMKDMIGTPLLALLFVVFVVAVFTYGRGS